jgi:Family of unknown function (DUF6178)
MSKTTKRATALRAGASVEDRLERLLDTPFLARVVPHLPPEMLHRLIQHRGLDASGDLVTSATPAQLTSLLDLDLWHRARPGRNERFDVDRFGEWLEVLVDAGYSVAARTVAALDPNLVVAGLSRYVRVFDPGIFEPIAQSDDEPPDRHAAMRDGDSIEVDEAIDDGGMSADDVAAPDSSGDSLEYEVGGYIVRARRSDAWDAIVTLLVALDTEHGSYFHAVMQGCRRLSNSRSEIDGLADLLMAPEQHLHDVAVERERRRSQQGYATPADSRAFLQMARQSRHRRSEAAATAVNPIVTAYFRAADETAESAAEPAPAPARRLESSSSMASPMADVPVEGTDVPESLDAVMELLIEAGVMPERPRALLAAGDADPQTARLPLLRRLLQWMHDTDDTAYFARHRELAFVANVLAAGCSLQSRAFTPQEAADAAASICNLGLEYWPARWPSVTSREVTRPHDSFLIDHDLVTAFEVGWSVLHQDVSLFVAQQLISTLGGLHVSDRDIRRGLVALRRALVKQRDAGTPWLARGAADVLAMLDVTVWTSVLGLLDECPVLPAAATAILEGRATTISPTAFDFISTAAQIGDVRLFTRKLPDLLSR